MIYCINITSLKILKFNINMDDISPPIFPPIPDILILCMNTPHQQFNPPYFSNQSTINHISNNNKSDEHNDCSHNLECMWMDDKNSTTNENTISDVIDPSNVVSTTIVSATTNTVHPHNNILSFNNLNDQKLLDIKEKFLGYYEVYINELNMTSLKDYLDGYCRWEPYSNIKTYKKREYQAYSKHKVNTCVDFLLIIIYNNHITNPDEDHINHSISQHRYGDNNLTERHESDIYAIELYVVQQHISSELDKIKKYCSCITCASSTYNPLKYMWCSMCTGCLRAGPEHAKKEYIDRAYRLLNNQPQMDNDFTFNIPTNVYIPLLDTPWIRNCPRVRIDNNFILFFTMVAIVYYIGCIFSLVY